MTVLRMRRADTFKSTSRALGSQSALTAISPFPIVTRTLRVAFRTFAASIVAATCAPVGGPESEAIAAHPKIDTKMAVVMVCRSSTLVTLSESLWHHLRLHQYLI